MKKYRLVTLEEPDSNEGFRMPSEGLNDRINWDRIYVPPKQQEWKELEPFARTLNEGDIGHRVRKVMSIKHGMGYILDNSYMHNIYVLDNITYDEFGGVNAYIIHDDYIEHRVTDQKFFDGWVNLDKIGG